ncbi:pilus assembly protein TadG-related protein [Terriglobus sp. TAA 43]|uniref:pilus assembly protein TadG-related protein n=1 Tax=Terriglobus sp. TAA 43 TaxID=278961 RepID=UPI000A0470BA|nr:pilus assembly protein TadG-related protein [Terriglobus sp. TAA 43]
MRRLFQLRDDSGQVLVITALCMVVLIGFLGLAVDIGSVRHEQRRLQNAADASALAAALEVRVCGSTPNCAAMQTAAQNALVENGYTGSSALITDCASSPGSGLTITLHNPLCPGSSDPNKSRYNYVETQVSEKAPLYFSRIFGFTGFNLSARAEAARGVGGPCIYALNPSASGALNVGVGVGFRSNCGVVVESSSRSSVNCLVGLGVTAPYVQVSPTGGGASLLCLGSTHVTQAPVPVPADPLAYLPAPPNANDPCGTSSGNVYNGSQSAVQLGLLAGLTGNVTFNPGVYCGGISITAALLSNITFNPGTYILRNGPVYSLLGIRTGTASGFTMTVSVLSSIVGNGVTFYNEGDAGSFSLTASSLPLQLSNFQLTAPTSGNYGGILFWQASGVQNTGTFLATLLQGSRVDGVIYMPSALVTYGVSVAGGASKYNGIVADRVQFTANVLSVISNDYSTLLSGAPFNGDRSELVQ